MALNFPDTPTIGQTFPQPPVSGMPIYTWDGEKWTSASSGISGGGATIYASDTPPAGALDNTLWLETDTGMMFFRWNDGNSSQWVALASGPSGTVLYSNPQSLTVPQKAQARANINAASLDALANQNLVINGAMNVSQEMGRATGAVTVSSYTYIVDGWLMSVSFNTAGLAVYFAQENGSGTPFTANIVMSVSGASPATATSGFSILQVVEGNRWSRLAWGTPNAQPISIGFWASAENAPGVMTLSIRNYAFTRSYCTPFNVGPAPTYFTMTIPGCTDGSWPQDNTQSAVISFVSATGSNYMAAAANAWLNGRFSGAPTQTDLHAAGANAIRVWGVTVIPGTIPVPQELAPFAQRHYDQELLTCQRYFRQWGGRGAYEKIMNICVTSATQVYGVLPLSVPMRVYPTIVVSAPADWMVATQNYCTVTGVQGDIFGDNAICLGFACAGAAMVIGQAGFVQSNNNVNARYKLDARL